MAQAFESVDKSSACGVWKVRNTALLLYAFFFFAEGLGFPCSAIVTVLSRGQLRGQAAVFVMLCNNSHCARRLSVRRNLQFLPE